MPNYRRPHVSGGTYFITQVTYQRNAWLCSGIARKALREAIEKVRKKYFFSIDAFVLLPDHFHCLWTLPPDDSDLSVRLRLIKTYVTKHYGQELGVNGEVSRSRQKRGEKHLWQRRFWEHLIRDERDFIQHCDYIHDNPVRHGFCKNPQDWQYSSIHRFIALGIYPQDWGSDGTSEKPQGSWDD
ncbi:REP-associated tyrosine transposase [Gloeothece verrucosa]|uniref:Transposase IS200-like domain-containing protein n=1 Tax=Gloeothece verrucosa (strain PCC 7822) TaxID=497965 RepID=E0U7Y1_GLOV7|nr:transposase [Gloeothece verrucosa]ADN16068.1 conserved hypothetical protein [Gloeothece verrucosa PCC 7822]